MRRYHFTNPAATLIPILLFSVTLLYHVSRIPSQFYSLLASSNNNQSACSVPLLDPFDQSILRYIAKSAPLKCNEIQGDLLKFEAGGLVFDAEVLQKAGLKRENLKCKYRTVQHNSGVDDDSVKYGAWLDLKERVETDFVDVYCKSGVSTIYSRILSHVHPKSTNQNKIGDGGSANQNRPNVLIVGIDSMSRSNMIRQLPKSFEFLKDDLRSVIFDKHVKVGDNTFVNLVAILAGRLIEGGNGFRTELDVSSNAHFFDDWAPWIWKNFSDRGYRTLYAEDRADIHTFNYVPKKGFRNPPTDHYFRPFYLAKQWTTVARRSSSFCYNSVPEHVLMLDYLRDFGQKYSQLKIPFFGFLWWQNLSHDLLNPIGMADTDLLNFLTHVKKLKNTILIVVSDHGHRYDAIRESIIGRMESRLPFLSISLPESIDRKVIDRNAKKLTTQFDLHATLSGLLGGRDDLNAERAYNLISEDVPVDRNCRTAHIPPDYCPCYDEKLISVQDEGALAAAHALIAHVNDLLLPYKQCQPLRLSHILDAHVFAPGQKMLRDPQVGIEQPRSGFYVQYRVQLQSAKPSGAVLEGVVQRSFPSDRYTVAGSVDRNNAYGNSSDCVKHEAVLRKFCYCL